MVVGQEGERDTRMKMWRGSKSLNSLAHGTLKVITR
jgi:hypothetical protein